MNSSITSQTKHIGLSEFWDIAKRLKLFTWVNIALILSCISVYVSLPTSITALLYLIASVLSVLAGVRSPVEGLACYFSLSFYTALPVVITGSPFLSSFKDVLLVIAIAAYLLTAKYRKKVPRPDANIYSNQPFYRKRSSLPSVARLLLILFITLAIIVLSILFFRYQDITLFLLGFRAYFFYLLIAVIAYKKLPIHSASYLTRAIIIAALGPSIIGVLQVIQIVWSPAWLPPLTLYSQDEVGDLFQGDTGAGIVQETLELIRTPATLTGVPQFACLNIIVGIAVITLISQALTLTVNGEKISSKQWVFLLLLSVFFFISTLAGGNRMPIAVLLLIGISSFFTVMTLPKHNSQTSPSYFSRNKRKVSRVMIIVGFISVAVLAVIAVGIYIISLLPDVYMRYIGSIGYQIGIRIQVLVTQIGPIFQFPLIDQFFGVGPATQSAGSRYLHGVHASHIGGDLHAESQLLQQMVELGIIFFPIYFLPRIILVILCLKKLLTKRNQLYSEYLLPLAISFGILTIVPYGNFITLDPMNAFYWLIGGLLLKFTCKKDRVTYYQ